MEDVVVLIKIVNKYMKTKYMKTTKFITIRVEWETDGQEVDLPTIIMIPDYLKTDEDITNWLSNKYGWLVKSFSR